MAPRESYQWKPPADGTPIPADASSRVGLLDRTGEAQRQDEQDLLVWVLAIAVVFFGIFIGGIIRFRRGIAAKEAERVSSGFFNRP